MKEQLELVREELKCKCKQENLKNISAYINVKESSLRAFMNNQDILLKDLIKICDYLNLRINLK